MPDAFDDVVAQFLREQFEEEPVGASFYGLTEWDGRLPDVSADGFRGGRRRRAGGSSASRGPCPRGWRRTSRWIWPCSRRTWDSRWRPPTSPTGAATRRPTWRTASSSCSSMARVTSRRPPRRLSSGWPRCPTHSAAGRENLDPTLVDADCSASGPFPTWRRRRRSCERVWGRS